jgi:26S proteasome regulatory subunit N5
MYVKRRGQLKGSVQAVVQWLAEYLDEVSVPQEERALLTTLLEVTDGKIYVEVERARLVRRLAAQLEADGSADEAKKALSEVQVETFGAMDKAEKTDFVLEQMRLCLATADLVRTLIVSRKINRKVLNDDDLQSHKVRFYTLMAEYHACAEEWLDVARCYEQIVDVPLVRRDPKERLHALRAAIMYAVLSPFDSESNDLVQRIDARPEVAEIAPAYKRLLSVFLTPEIMRWPKVRAEYEGELAGSLPSLFGGGAKRDLWETLRQRVIEHNVRTVSTYYQRIRLARLGELLDLTADEAETFVTKLVTTKTIYARIDRPAGLVVFARPVAPEAALNKWGGEVQQLLAIVESTCHLIAKENMIHGVSP